MRWIIASAVLAVAFSASAAVLQEDFEGVAPGGLPAGWTLVTPWGDWAPGPVTAEVAASPTGGQALKFVHGTDWVGGGYGASSGEVDTPFLAVGSPTTDKIMIEFDMWKENWRTWQVGGDQAWINSFPGAAVHMNDNPAGPNEMYVGRDGPAPADLTDAPEGEWMNVSLYYDAASGMYSNVVSYASGSGGGTFTGTDDNEIAGQFWFGGWAFQSTMDADPSPPGGNYDNAVYIDNFRMEVVPEPATMTLLGLAGLAFLRRRR